MNFNNKNILILGYGKSGVSAKNFLENIANKIYIYDEKFKVKILKNNKNKLKNNKKINIFNKKKVFLDDFNLINDKIHFCIISPGIDINSKIVKIIKQKNIKIISELELGASACKGKIFAITGTNGKTTTCNLLFEIFKKAKLDAYLCGNVGTPITEIAKLTTNKSVIVCEVSSFQMETTNYFKPFASAILNLEPDHLDRHKNCNNYFYLKTKIFKDYKTKKITNYDNINCKKLIKNYKNIIFFTKNNKKLINFIKNNYFYNNINIENIFCAITLARQIGIKDKYIIDTIKNFKGLEHRLELVANFNNITYINDSKSTNVASTISALDTIKKDVILLLGGSEKKLDFKPIFEKQNIKYIIAYGETKYNLLNCCKTKNITVCDNFNLACKTAFDLAEQNDIVLLSPACASFDEFKNYEERGNVFKNLVNEYIFSHTLKN